MTDEKKKRIPKRIKEKPLEESDKPKPKTKPEASIGVDLVYIGPSGAITIKGARLQSGDVLSFPAPDASELLKRYPGHWERR